MKNFALSSTPSWSNRFMFRFGLSGLLAAAVTISAASAAPAAMLGNALFVAPADRGVAADVVAAHGMRGVRDLGRLDASSPVTIGVLMRVRNLAELQQLTLLQGKRSSPMYHHYLTKAQWTQYFAPTAQTYAQTMAVLQRRGFRVVRTYDNRNYLEVQATANTVERYFRTELHKAVQTGKRGTRFFNVTPAIMPNELRSVAISVSGLHSIQLVSHPLRFGHPAFHAGAGVVRLAQRTVDRPLDVPTPLGTSTPGPNPSPDATEVPGDPLSEYASNMAYDPTIYASAYDYPVNHGFGGSGHPTGTVIEADYLDSDAALEFSTYNIPRTGGLGHRFCSDPTGGPTCDDTIGQPDPEGESTLDAETIMSLAPAAPFYEIIGPLLDDEQLEAAYEIHVNMDVVDDVNSSFGACETDDPAFGYATNYIAMEGAALGISFEASTGDTGATGCGTYVTNGAPQSEFNISVPSAGYYFTALGGSQFYPLTTCSGTGNGSLTSPCYTHEDPWTFANGGFSAREPVPCWQLPALTEDEQTSASVGSTTMRNTPDIVFTSNPDPPYAGILITMNGGASDAGGTSVASPMWTAMQVEINQAQGSRNGWVNPGLYAAFLATNTVTTNYAFRDIVTGNNERYTAVPGYDDASGLGSPLGWELAGVENGYPPSYACAS